MIEIDTQEYVRTWRLLAVKGALLVLFGFLALAVPGATIAILVVFFGALAFLNGIFALLAVLGGRISSDHRWVAIAEGVLGILVGLITFFYPRLTVSALIFLIAIWAITVGAIQIITAVNLRHRIDYEWVLGLSGGLFVLIGLVFLAFPVGALATIAFLIGVSAIIVGIATVVFAIRLRSMVEDGESILDASAASVT